MSLVESTAGAQRVRAGSGIGANADWRHALAQALEDALDPLDGALPNLLLLFVSDSFHLEFEDLLREAANRSGAFEVAGCSASAVIGQEQELEGQTGVAALAFRFPDNAFLALQHVAAEDIQNLRAGESDGAWPSLLGLQPAACTGLVVLADPFTASGEDLIEGLQAAYPGVPMVGGMASAMHTERRTWVFHGNRAHADGAVVLAFGGSVALQAVVSQGAEPIGQPWTITKIDGHVIHTIGNRPAYEVLVETLNTLGERERRRAARNLLVGLAMDEYRDTFQRGDFLIRNLMGVDQSSGAIAVAAHTRLGQTLQFQVRDGRAAHEEMEHLLRGAATSLGESPAAAILFACNGRGKNLFGTPHHDAQAVSDLLGAPPLAGFFCNGEIGPVGDTTYLHGFTASLGLIVPRAEKN